MRDYAGLYKQLMIDSNRAFIKQIQEEQAREKLEAKADCQCNGGGFAYCKQRYAEKSPEILAQQATYRVDNRDVINAKQRARYHDKELAEKLEILQGDNL